MPRLDYEEKEQECLAKDEQIQVKICFLKLKKEIFFVCFLQILNAKIRRLEHLLHLKDVRIQDLSEKYEGHSPSKSVIKK